MVRAILEGRKTVTRRVIKNTDASMYAGLCGFGPGLFSEKTGLRVKEPYYRLGDILYVRETWNQLARVDENGYTHYNDLFYVYKADKNQPDLYDDNGFYLDDTARKWRPSIHMP